MTGTRLINLRNWSSKEDYERQGIVLQDGCRKVLTIYYGLTIVSDGIHRLLMWGDCLGIEGTDEEIEDDVPAL